jgi:hypothetical protein
VKKMQRHHTRPKPVHIRNLGKHWVASIANASRGHHRDEPVLLVSQLAGQVIRLLLACKTNLRTTEQNQRSGQPFFAAPG